MAKAWYDCVEAEEYLEKNGINCNPYPQSDDNEGTFVVELLLKYPDRYDDYDTEDDPHYKKSTLNRIIKETEEWRLKKGEIKEKVPNMQSSVEMLGKEETKILKKNMERTL